MSIGVAFLAKLMAGAGKMGTALLKLTKTLSVALPKVVTAIQSIKALVGGPRGFDEEKAFQVQLKSIRDELYPEVCKTFQNLQAESKSCVAPLIEALERHGKTIDFSDLIQEFRVMVDKPLDTDAIDRVFSEIFTSRAVDDYYHQHGTLDGMYKKALRDLLGTSHRSFKSNLNTQLERANLRIRERLETIESEFARVQVEREQLDRVQGDSAAMLIQVEALDLRCKQLNLLLCALS
jgi:hypothetical protein